MIEANFVSIPMIKGSTILLSKGKNVEFNIIDYQRLVRKLMHLLQTTRFNLAFVVGKLG